MKSFINASYPWAPAAFCGLVVATAVFRSDLPGVLLFLPMCFFFSAISTLKLRQEIRALELQLAEVRRTTK